ncbi:thioesterase [Bacterioplanes sanyensis]|uniref:Thioesterase n=1 Tax=Bacterioplanes sanyensis TaxID=1249553 RepID=A0A222FFM1_9GAMM|nr:hotdog domain-containing protein [Bacterioplanes sanyensis]ASP37808.1 thioesterase [Bacterioplanes sanyensis]
MTPSDQYHFEYTVAPHDTAKALSISADDDFPDVFATSRMVAVLELAAARLMQSELQPGELSVGVNVNVDHVAATPIGATVKAIARFIGMQGKLYAFEVELHDGAGLAGKGTHTRAIVSTERLLQGAAKRG